MNVPSFDTIAWQAMCARVVAIGNRLIRAMKGGGYVECASWVWLASHIWDELVQELQFVGPIVQGQHVDSQLQDLPYFVASCRALAHAVTVTTGEVNHGFVVVLLTAASMVSREQPVDIEFVESDNVVDQIVTERLKQMVDPGCGCHSCLARSQQNIAWIKEVIGNGERPAG